MLSEYPISYVKWDCNRDIVDGLRAPRGRPGRARPGAAVYALMDRLRAVHPAVEWESCAAAAAGSTWPSLNGSSGSGRPT